MDVDSRTGEPKLRMRFRIGVEGAEGGPALVELRERREGEVGQGSNSVRTIVLKEALACSIIRSKTFNKVVVEYLT